MNNSPFTAPIYIEPRDRAPLVPDSPMDTAYSTLDCARQTTSPAVMSELLDSHFSMYRRVSYGIDAGIILAAEELVVLDDPAPEQKALREGVEARRAPIEDFVAAERPVWAYTQAEQAGTNAVEAPAGLVDYLPRNPYLGENPDLTAAIAVTHYNSLVDAATVRNKRISHALTRIRSAATEGLLHFSEHDELDGFLQTRLGRTVLPALTQAVFFNFQRMPENDGKNLVQFALFAGKLGSISVHEMMQGRATAQKLSLAAPADSLLRIDL